MDSEAKRAARDRRAAEAERAAEAQAAAAAAQTAEDEGESSFNIDTELGNLENRIAYLEAAFARQKEMRARQGKRWCKFKQSGKLPQKK